jgi:muconolactone delta-isomerase
MEYLVTKSGVEFLTTFIDAVPAGTPSQAVDDAKAGEARRARELTRQGHLVRLWVLPGKGRALGLYQAADASGMQAILESLPLYPWMKVETIPLTQHPSDPAIVNG